jgi:selenocysteine-specific elongation factor
VAEVRVRGLESLGRRRDSVSGTARVALDLAGDLPDEALTVLATPDAWEWTDVVDVRLRVPAGADPAVRLPAAPHLHVGAATVPVHARPLGEHHARLTLPAALPLRLGDRAVLRDPGSRALWGAEVLDCGPPRLARRGAARERSAALQGWRGTVADQVRARGLAELVHLERIGAHASELDPGTLAAGGWLLSAPRAEAARAALAALVDDGAEEGIAVAAAARALQLPHDMVRALVDPPLRVQAGRALRPRVHQLPPRLQRAVDTVRADLAAAPFAAPDAGRLRELGLDERAVTALHRRGDLLHVGSSVVLLPDAPDEAVRRLAALQQPFTTSEARQALETSRRVAMPLLAHLDRTARTVRLADDRRRLR